MPVSFRSGAGRGVSLRPVGLAIGAALLYLVLAALSLLPAPLPGTPTIVRAAGPTVSAPDLDAASDTGPLAPATAVATLRPSRDESVSATEFSSGTTGWNLVDEVTLVTTDYVRPRHNGYAIFGFPTSTLRASDTIQSITVKANVRNAASSMTSYLQVRNPATGTRHDIASIVQNAPNAQSITLATRPWDSAPWTLADLNALQVGGAGCTCTTNYGLTYQVRQLWVEVTYTTLNSAAFSADNVTNDATPSFSGTVGTGATRVDLYRATDLVGTDSAVSDGIWNITASTVSDGVHSFTAKAVNAANEVTTSAALSVTVETVAPPSPPPPDLDAASDTGVANDDDITDDLTPSFSGTSTTQAVQVELYADTARVATDTTVSDGTWTGTASALTGATYAFTAKATDLAGNSSAASSALSVELVQQLSRLRAYVAPLGDVGSVSWVSLVTQNEQSQPIDSYSGTVTLSSSDAGATFPDGATYTMRPGLDGTGHDFRVVFSQPGNHTVTATAPAAQSASTPAVAVTDVSLSLSVPESVNANVPFAVTVTPRKTDGLIARQYASQVTLASSEPNANFGPLVDSQRRYRFDCGCGDGETFSTTLPTTGSFTISVSDPYGHTASKTVQVTPAPTTGTDPINAITAVQWPFGTIVDYYVDANAPYTILSTEDLNGSLAVLSSESVNRGFGAGRSSFSTSSSAGGHIVAPEWYEAGHHRVRYANAAGTVFSRCTYCSGAQAMPRVERFSDVPGSANYSAIDPGDPLTSWTIVSRSNEQTRVRFVAEEPFLILNVAYSFNGTIWDPGQPTPYYVGAGTTEVSLSNAPAHCYAANTLYANDNLRVDYIGLGSGFRRGRLMANGITTSSPGYPNYGVNGGCSTSPPPGAGDQGWLGGVATLAMESEEFRSVVFDPVDTANGSFRDRVTDFSLGGLTPALSLTRTYDGREADASGSAGAPDSLFGRGWTSDFDWQIVTFGTNPTGVKIRGADGGYLHFLRQTDGSYEAVGGPPFTFHEVGSTYELRRLDGSGYRFGSTGRLSALFDDAGRTLSLAYDGTGALTSLTDAADRTASVTTDASGHITRIDLPDGRYTAYTYASGGRLETARDLSGTSLRYVTDVRARITAIRNEAGEDLLRNVYDGSGRVIRQTDATGAVSHLAFDAPRGTTQAFGARGDRTTSCQDANGHLLQRFDAGDGAASLDYDSYGHVRSATDELGAVSRFRNDRSGRVQSATDPLGRAVSITYNASGKPATITDATGRVLTPTYNAQGLPASVSLASGTNSAQIAAYGYTPARQPETITEPGGAVTTLAYDARGYLSSVIDPEGRNTTFTTDARGYVTAVVDALGNAPGGVPADHDTLSAYDAMGRLTSVTDPSGAATGFTYDSFGRLASETNALGFVTTYAYDAGGRVISMTAQVSGSVDAVTRFEYDAAGNVTAVIDPENRRTEFTYDLLGRLTETRDADGQVWTTGYDRKGRVISELDPTGRRTRFFYDAADRLTKVEDPGGHETLYAYDDADRLVTVTDPLGNETTQGYDWRGRPTSTTNGLDQTTTLAYNAANDLTSVTDAANHTTSYSYNAAHQLTSVLDALNGETLFGYDAAGRLTSRQNARGNSETFACDALGRPTSVSDPLSNLWTTAYDALGRVSSTTDAKGQQTGFSYDRLGRLLTLTPASGSPISFTYDKTGRRVSITDGAGAASYAYDPVGRLTSTTRGGRTVGYAYDNAGRPTSVSYPGGGGTVSYTYDVEGRLATISDWSSRETSFSYDAADRVTSLSRPGNLATSYTLDALGRPTAVEHSRSGSTLLALGYTYDPAGNIATLTDDLGQATFTYDALDRLTAASYPGSQTYAYTYDAVGNVTQAVTPSGTTNRTYDAADRISDAGYVWDANGALTADGTKTYTYDPLGRLTGVTGTGLSAAYTLDGDGNRVAATMNGTSTAFDLDLRLPNPTILAEGGRRYLPGAPSLGYEESGAWWSGLTDHQGSLIGLVSGSGTPTAFTHYDPYGAPRPGSTVPTGIGHAGEWADATGLTNLRARAYDPTLGRFISRDSFGGVASAPLTGNRYLYGLANPLRYTDPSGHFVGQLAQWGGTQLGAALEKSPLPIALEFLQLVAETEVGPSAPAPQSPIEYAGGFIVGFGGALVDAGVGYLEGAACALQHQCLGQAIVSGAGGLADELAGAVRDPRGSIKGALKATGDGIVAAQQNLLSGDGQRAGRQAGAITVVVVEAGGVAKVAGAAGAVIGRGTTGARFLVNEAGIVLDTSRIAIAEAKYGYLLTNPSKAGVFADSMGFTRGSLEPALRQHLLDNFGTATAIRPMPGGGSIVTVAGSLVGPSGQQWMIRSVWGIGPDGTLRLITATP